MRHKYDTRGLVLARTPTGEANAFFFILTDELGLVRVRAQGVRKSGAKLASGLATFAESDLVLVRGKEGWRITGAVLSENWFVALATPEARGRLARVAGLLLRLVAGESQEPGLFRTVSGFVRALNALPTALHDAAEILAVLRVLSILGFDAGTLPGAPDAYTETLLAQVEQHRREYISRINTGIQASGL